MVSHGGVLNYHSGNLNYHGGISSLPTETPDTHPSERQPSGASTDGGAASSRPPLCGYPYGWVSAGWVGKEEIPPW